MKRKFKNKHSFEKRQEESRKILTKYPDKVVSVVDRDRDTVVIMDTCRLILVKE